MRYITYTSKHAAHRAATTAIAIIGTPRRLSAVLYGLLLLSLLFFLSLATACFRGNELSIVKKNFDREISRNENLIVTFNHDLAPDSLIAVWDSTQYLKFEPQIPGRYRWNSPNELVFSPLQPLAPGTDFKAVFTDALLAFMPKDSKVKLPRNTTLDFHTPYLELEKADATWQVSGDNEPGVAVLLVFSYEVDPKELAEKMTVKVNGKPVKYDLLSAARGAGIKMEIRGIDYSTDSDLTFTVSEGMSVAGSTNKTKSVISKDTKLPRPDQMSVLSIDAQHDGDEGQITVTTSQQVVAEDLDKFVAIEPKISFTVSTNANGFTVSSSQFDPIKTYKLTVKKDLEGIFKSKLADSYLSDVAFGKLDPDISFVDGTAQYLSNKGYKNIALRMIGVQKVKVSIYKIFSNNLYSFLRSGMDYEGYWDEESDEYIGYNRYRTDDYGQMIFEQEYPAAKMRRMGQVNLLHLDFADKLSQFEGIYVIEVRDTEHEFIRSSKIVSFSDIGLIAKKETNGIYVFANSIIDAQPLSGAKITFVSRNNQNIYNATTNSEGVAIFDGIKEKAPDFEVGMIFAQLGKDFNYMNFENANVNTARFDVSGKFSNPSGYDAYIYGERDLYRPGETIHLNALVRNMNWTNPSQIPVRLTLLLPNGKEYRSVRKTLSDEGAVQADFDLPAATVTGTYAAELYTGNDILLAAKPISVEEFMPDRIKFDLETDKKEGFAGQSIGVKATAVNLFGPPAADRSYEVSLSLSREPFLPKGFEKYIFEIDNYKYFDDMVKEGRTDAMGKFAASFDIPADYQDMGLLKGKFYATVFDENGRPVNRSKSVNIYTQDVFYGIGNISDYVSTRTPFNIPLVAVSKDEKAIAAEATVEIIRHEWRTVLESTGNNRYQYRSEEEDIVEVAQKVKISGTSTQFAFTPSKSGNYKVRVSRTQGSKGFVEKQFYAYRFGDTESTSFEVNREGRVDITFDKEKYQVGENAKILFTCPFEGRLLVTLERDKVLKHYYFNTDKKAKQMPLTLPAEYVPNVFVSATLIRPMRELNVPLTVAHGYASLAVDNQKNHIPVTIEAEDQTRSKTKQKIRIKTEPNTELTLAVVDEGVLQIKNYKTPDPYNYFYQQRALEVNSYDIYPFLFPEMVAGEMLTGGDGGYDLSKRVNPMTNKRVKLVSYWSGLLRSDSKGMVNYEVNIPQFSGDLRVMAVAYKGGRFGSADDHIKVADPVVISSGVPRFLSPNDTITVPVTLSNTTPKNAQGTATITVEGPLNVVGSATQNVNLPANAETRAEFKIVAANDIGEGKITVQCKAMNETFSEVIDLGIRPAASLQKTSGSGTIEGSKTQVVEMPNNYLPESIDGQLIVSTSPMAQFSKDLADLIGYPYGCVEQTISRAFPQIYVQDLAKSIGRQLATHTGKTEQNPNYNIQEAINKLGTMQLNNGGMSYWQGGEEESWWGSVYAAHFLYEAQQAGFEVNKNVLEGLNKYLQVKLADKSTYTYTYYDREGKKQSREIAHKEIAYTLYILALQNKPAIPTMNYYKSKSNLLSLDSRYLLAAAYTLAGDPNKGKQVLPTSFEGETAINVNDNSFDSGVRSKALALNALLEVNPKDPQTGLLTKHLIDDFKKDRYHSTQESVFTLLALGKLAKINGNEPITATITAGGKKIADFDGNGSLALKYSDFKAGKVQINTKGNGKLYYFWGLEGLTRDGSFKQEDNFIKVRRQYFDRFGKPLAKNTFKQNDLIVVKISLVSLGANNVNNVVVTDILPAGLEVENPRITDQTGMSWAKDAAMPQHQDFRDDRVNIFTTATANSQSFYYTVRAVSLGNYRLGPVSADAMYDGEYHSYNGAGTVTVMR